MLIGCARRLALTGLLLGALPALGQVLVSEFLASGSKDVTDENGDHPDWIELYNSGTQPVTLAGWYLTDDPADLRKWRLPATNLVAEGYALVFASGKDRHVAGAPLHTNFKLTGAGEYLALVQPDGVTVASAYAPAYPPQAPGLSYGLPMGRVSSVLVSNGSPARLLAPLDDSLGEQWTTVEFDDSAWLPAKLGVGFAAGGAAAATPAVMADSVADFSDVQGQNGWFYGAYDKTADLLAGYETSDFVPFPRSAGPPSASNFWNGASWKWFDGDPPWVELGARYARPNGSNSGHEIWAVRRWSCPVTGPLNLQWQFAKQNPIGSGVTARIFRNGAQLTTLTLRGDDLLGVTRTNAVPDAQAGDVLDFALLPLGPGSAPDDRGDGAYFSVLVWASQSLTNGFRTDVAAAMGGISPSLLVRAPFVLGEGRLPTALTLRLKYNDGFVAYLNGVLVAQANAPFPAAWDATATATGSALEASQWQEFDLSGWVGLLQPGANVLALQGLNIRAESPDFLLAAELRAATLTIETNAARYFALPTPRAPNGYGDPKLGPLVLEVTHHPAAPVAGQDLLVTARVIPSFQPVESVRLTYRAMFGAESTLAMADDGQHGDGAAGDGVFAASLPTTNMAPGQLLRYYLTASDRKGNLTRAPLYADPANSPQYYGTVTTNPAVNSALPVLEWFVQSASAANSSTGARGALFHAGRLYDNVRFYVHGQSSLGFPKKSYNVDLNTGDHFAYDPRERPVKKFNLLTVYPDKAEQRNILSYDTFRNAGAPYHIAFPVRVQQNGQFFSVAHFVEDGDEEFLARLGRDPRGALYKMYNNLNTWASDAEKKTRRWEGTADLQALVKGLQKTGATKTQFLCDNVDLPEVINYLAAITVTGNIDYGHKNYYVYRDSDGTGEWQVLPWDVDLAFGRNWTGSLAYFDDAMYPSNPLFVSNGNLLFDSLFAWSPAREMYLRRLRSLMDDLVQPTNTPPSDLKLERRINELTTLLTPDAALDYAKWPTWGIKQTLPAAVLILTNQYLPARRRFLFRSQSVGGGGPIPNPQPLDTVVVLGALEVNPASGNQDEEYVQVLNRNSYAADLSGWRLTGALEHTFHPGTVMPANSVLYASPNVVAFRARAAAPHGGQGAFIQGNYHGRLSARGETLYLLDASGRLVNSLTYPPNPTAAQQYLRITELMYAPAPPGRGDRWLASDYEYLALKNIGPAPLDLTGAHFTSGLQFVFRGAAVTNLPPGETLVLARNPPAFAERYGEHPRVVGPYEGSLANAGEKLGLSDGVGEQVLEFSFSPGWQPLSDGLGLSLVVVDAYAPWTDWNQREQWQAGGAPALGLGEWKTQYFTVPEQADPGIGADLADPDGDGQNNLQEYLAGTNPRDGNDRLRLEVAAGAPGEASIRFQFRAVAGRSYVLEAREELARGPWHWVGRPITARRSGLHFLIPLPAESAARFYRLATPPQPAP